MKGIKKFVIAGIALLVALPGAASAGFAPKFTVALSDTKALGNPELKFHLEFTTDDEEIGNFKGFIPKGFNIASDEQIPTAGCKPGDAETACKGELIGGGSIKIAAGPGCHPSSPSKDPKVDAPITATFYEKARTDEEADSGVHAVWFLDLEPANRVRLLVTGSPKTGWWIEGAPTPSDFTCNALTVDLTINAKSESGVPIVTNPKKPGNKLFMADIFSQDSPSVAHFEQVLKITK
jgi:hypothetical protein